MKYFRFHEEIEKRITYKDQGQLYGYFHKFGLHVIQE